MIYWNVIYDSSWDGFEYDNIDDPSSYHLGTEFWIRSTNNHARYLVII